MKVLIINSFFSVGGPPRIVNGIYDTLVENGIECVIAASREYIFNERKTYRICKKSEIFRNILSARIFDNDGFLSKKSTKKLIKYIEEYNPDIINIHNMHGYYLDIKTLFKYLAKINKPIIITLHDCWLLTGHCTNFEKNNCLKWNSCGCNNCEQKSEYPKSIFLDSSIRHYNLKNDLINSLKNVTIISPSYWLDNYVSKSFLKNINHMVINNGIDTSIFKNTIHVDLSKKFNKKIILGVAQNWMENKGFEDFIRLSKIINDNYIIILVGLTKHLIKCLPSNIIGIERTRDINNLINYYSNAYVFVNMTYQDNFPTVNIEALACELPIITYDTGGCKESLNSLSGYVVDKGDYEGVWRIIKGGKIDLINREDCRARALQFERINKYKEYMNLFFEMVNKND